MNKVSIIRCNGYEEEEVYQAVRESLELLGGLKSFVKKGMRVGIKPNLLLAKSPDGHATTHPSVIAAIGRLVKECGAYPVLIESPGGPYVAAYLKGTYKVCGMTAVCKKHDIEMNVDLTVADKVTVTERNTRKISVLKPLLDCDVIINACKMKTHAMMVFTGAIKNMFGSVAGTEKAAYHINSSDYDKFANDLIDIYNTTKPLINIMDGIMAMEGEGPSGGDPKKVGLILASNDGFALDSAAHDILKIDKMQSFIMKNAKIRGIDILYETLGETITNVIVPDFKVPFQLKGKMNSNFMNFIMKKSKSRPIVIPDLCIGCQICKKNCPVECINMLNDKPEFDYSKCIRCFCCQELCPESAIKVKKPAIIRMLSGGR